MGAENLPPPPGFDPQTVQPVASRYTYSALPTPHFYHLPIFSIRLKSSGVPTVSTDKYEGWNFNSDNYLFTTDTK